MRRTFKYRAYPTHAQAEALHAQLDEACRLYNAALDERRSAWQMKHLTIDYFDQANQLKAIRAAGDLGVANFGACQDVLRRLDRTFAAFFRRLKAGEKAGYPHFRAAERRLRLAQRKLARRKKCSRRRQKARQELARMHLHVANQRRDFHHK